MYQKTTLDNGVRIITSEMPHTRSATVMLYYGVGSRYEQKLFGGGSHFIEHLVFKGTEKRPLPQQISEAIEGVGGDLNASTGLELTNYYAKVPSNHFSTALEVLTDMMDRPLFKEDDVERERQVIIEEINATLDTPSDLVGELFGLEFWGDQPVGQPVGGTRESVGAITRADLLAYLKLHYVPTNCVVSVAGNVQHKEVVQQVAAIFGDYPRVEHAGPPATGPLPHDRRALVYNKETEQANVLIGLPGLSYHDPDRYKLDVLSTVLGSGMSSRLFVELRENQGLCYSVGSYTHKLSDSGMFGLYGGMDVTRAQESVTAVLKELGKLKRERVGEQELTKAKEYMKGGFVLGLESTDGVASWLAGQEMRHGEIIDADEAMSRIDAVTSDDLHEMANRYFTSEGLCLAVIGPYEDNDEFLNLLEID